MKYFKIVLALFFLPLITKAQAVYFSVGSGSNVQGTELVIPVTVQNFSNIISMQGTVSFNPAVISFVNTENFGLSDFSSANFGTTNAESGKISFSWNDPGLSGVNLSDNDTVFSIRFLLTGTAGLSSVIEITNDITPIEVVDNLFNEKMVYTQSGSATVLAGSATSGLLFSLASVEGLSGQSVQVPVSVQDFTSMLSAQWTIAFNPAIISFTGISGFGLPGLSSANFGINNSGSGIITFSWNDATLAGISLIDGSEIFILNFNIIGVVGQVSPVQLVNSPTQLEFVDLSFSPVVYSLSQGSVTVGGPFIPEDIIIFADSVEGAMGQYIQVPVRVSDFASIISAQGSLGFNPAIAQFDQVVSFGLPNMTMANFGTTQAASGVVSFSWNDPDLSGENLADSSVIFTLQFLLVGNIGDQTPLNFTNAPTPFEFVKNDFTVLSYSSIPGNIKIIDLYELEVSLVSSTEICAGTNLMIQFSAIGNYSVSNVFTAYLSDSNGSFGSPISIGSVTSNVSGSLTATIPANTPNGTHYRIRVVASDPYYVGTDNATDITIHAKPTANAGSDQNICIGNSVILTASGGVDYEWNGGQTSAAITVSPLADAQYSVTVTDAFGCENADTVQVIVHALPVANAGSDVNICLGESASLSATGGTDYEWSSGQLIAGITVSPTATTQYIVSVTDVWTCQDVDTVVVNVFQVFANAGVNEDICSGASTLLTASGGTSYEWSTSETSAAITVSPLVSTNYIVTVTGVNACKDIDTVFVVVHALPNANAGSDQNICFGNSVILTASGGVGYVWNGGQTSAAITVSPLVDTQYSVSVTDAFGCENADTVQVIVHALPVANAGSDVNICFGESASLSATGGTDYEWSSGQFIPGITVSPTATTQYIVSVTDVWTCQDVDTVVVNVFQIFANAGVDEDICSGASTLLTASGGTSYEWSTSETSAAVTVSPLVSTNYIVTVTGVNACEDIDTVFVAVHALPNANAGSDQNICIGNSVILTASGGVGYEWNGGQTSAAITVSPLVDTQYSVSVTDAFGCEDADNVQVIVHALPVANAGSDVNICFGESASLSATGGTDYEWSSGQLIAGITVSPTATTQYIVSATDVWTCQDVDTVVVNVFQVFANAGTDVNICSGGSALLTATGGTSYEWSTSETSAAVTVSPLVSTNYIVTVTGVNACKDVDTVQITVMDPPSAPNIPSGTTVRCQDDDVENYSTNIVPEADTYTWVILPSISGTIAGTGENSSVTWNFNFTGTSDVFVIAENACGSDTSAILMVQTNPMPFPDLGNDTAICNGNSVFLDAGTADSYTWSDGFDQQIHEISTQGQVVVETSLGTCSNFDTINVYISNPTIEFGVDTIFSSGPVTLDAGAGFEEYLWNDASTGQTLLVSSPGWYLVTITNEFGCTANDSVYVDIDTEIEEFQLAEFAVYPNPVLETLTLEISTVKNEKFEIILMSATGVILDERDTECHTATIEKFEFGDKLPGVYFLIIKSAQNFEKFKIVR